MPTTIIDSPKEVEVRIQADTGLEWITASNSKASVSEAGVLQITGDEPAAYPAGAWFGVRAKPGQAQLTVVGDDSKAEELLRELYDAAVLLANEERNRGFGPAASVIEVAGRAASYLEI